MIFRLSTTSGITSCSRPEYKSSVFSRKIARSSARSLGSASASRAACARAGSSHTGTRFLRSATLILACPPPIGRGRGTFQTHARRHSSDANTSSGSNCPRSRSQRLRAGLYTLPFQVHPGHFHRPHGGFGNFRSDPVPWYQGDTTRHARYYNGALPIARGAKGRAHHLPSSLCGHNTSRSPLLICRR